MNWLHSDLHISVGLFTLKGELKKPHGGLWKGVDIFLYTQQFFTWFVENWHVKVMTTQSRVLPFWPQQPVVWWEMSQTRLARVAKMSQAKLLFCSSSVKIKPNGCTQKSSDSKQFIFFPLCIIYFLTHQVKQAGGDLCILSTLKGVN